MQCLKILKIGLGGCDDPAKGGRSPRMWKHYFPRSRVFSNGKDFAGDCEDLERLGTTRNLLKRLVDGLHYEEMPRRDYKPSYFDKHFTSLHVYHNPACLHKGRNDEGSNVVGKPSGLV